LTGRKVIVDTYGGAARHGGGCFSGKDPSKVDRSGAYAARHVAKNVVAAGLADRCEVQVAYAIGVAHPVSLMVETFGTGKLPGSKLIGIVSDTFDLRPGAIVRDLDLRRPIFQKTAAYGHFGRTDHDFTWEHRPRRGASRRGRPRGRPRRGGGDRPGLLAGEGLAELRRRRRLVAEALGMGRVGRAVPLLDHLVGIGDPGEDEVVIVARAVSVHVADLEQALQGGLVVVDVLNPLQARLLDLSRDDPRLMCSRRVVIVWWTVTRLMNPARTITATPTTATRVTSRHRCRRRDVGDDPDHECRDQHHEQPLDVEGDDRPPRRMALEHHPFPRCEPGPHRQSISATGAPSEKPSRPPVDDPRCAVRRHP
jgi:hypothetical protein